MKGPIFFTWIVLSFAYVVALFFLVRKIVQKGGLPLWLGVIVFLILGLAGFKMVAFVLEAFVK